MTTKNYFIQIAGYCAEEESYEEGCTGVIYDDTWEGESQFYANSKQEILSKISELLGIEENLLEIQKMDNDYENMFYVSFSMNEFYCTPSDEEISLWKQGEKKLYLTEFFFLISEMKKVENLSDLL